MTVDPRYRPELRTEAKRLYEKEKLSIRAVAERMGISRGWAEDLLRDAGVKFRRRGAPKKKKSKK